MKQTKALVEGAIMISIFAVMTLFYLYVPLLSIIFFMAAPIPIILYTIRHGLKKGIAAGAIGIVISFLIGSINGLLSAPMLIAVGVGMGVFYSRRQPGQAIITGALIYLFSFLIYFVVSVQLFQVDILGVAKESIDQIMPMVESTLKQSGASDQDIAKQLKQFREMQDTALNSLPVALLIFVTLMSFVNHWFVRPLIKRFVPDMPALKKFKDMRLPKSMVWYYLLTLLLMLIQPEKGSFLSLVQTSAFQILFILVLIQGFSFIFYYCHEKNISKVVPIFAVVLTILFPPIGVIVRIIGIADIGFDLREKVKTNNSL
ncbi:YybS family protein [Bacillus altitudinis]|uniref:YybS family protein n=1 Tax=Bacillus TaxID=1386 RepID=UPI00042F4C7F|nr:MULTISPECIES: YybS family protein [Bacillus]AHL73499.1 membrane protein [Bacillus pumilus]KOA74963.1 integral inner membrane protein [Bacillus stratosphericus]AKC68011.1 integral inner membrane protein [Bacillus altitudinis]MBU8970611.1 YybS family protein [Bacillus altitudinis]MCA0164223.1 YybS family protein [Bacillus sp. RAR_M1_44]